MPLKIPDLSPYTLALKIAGTALLVGAIVAFVMSWSSRGQQIAALTTWQNTVINTTTDATVEPDKKGVRKPLTAAQVPAAIAALKRTADSCAASVQGSKDKAATAQQKADEANKALANFQAVLNGEYSSAEKRIEALEHAKVQPTPDLQCQAIGVDSNAPWEGWK